VFYGANYARSQEEEAMPFIQQAIELDPSYADAHALLSHIYSQLYWRGLDNSEEMLEKYRQSLERASALNPNSPEALRAWANYHYRVHTDYARSLELLQQALAQAPGNVDIHGDIGLTLRRLGRWEESIDSFQQALSLDPDNSFYRAIMLDTMVSFNKWQDILDNSVPLEDAPPNEIDIQSFRAEALLNLTGDLEPLVRVFERMNSEGTAEYANKSAYVHLLRRDPDKAIEVLNGPVWAELIREPYNRTWHLFQLASAWRLKGDEEMARSFDEQAVADLDLIMTTNLQTRLFCGAIIAASMARLGRGTEAIALSNRISEDNIYERDALVWGTPVYFRAMILGLTGDADGAIADLQLMFDTPTDRYTAWDLYYDPNWDFMRDDPRFVELATPDNLIQ
jgi:tetratricopeptide (TPR) repeat protein